LTTKIHAAVEALGNPLRLRLSAGQVADIREAPALIQGLAAQAVVGDKGYDADEFVGIIEAQGAQAVIPPRKHRTQPRDYDRHLYKDRNLVERFFNRIKQFRRIATRYEKLAQNFLSMIQLVCAYIWLA
jgi:transposase